MLKPSEIEVWALNVVREIRAGRRVEDSRVEVKREWPAPERAARVVAAQCNAARGEPVLWVIGIDEDSGEFAQGRPDAAAWFPAFTSQFEGIAPDHYHMAVPVGDGAVAAVLFETSRAPYVVRNPSYGTANGGNIAFEVPWRAATSTRTAKRHELLEMLVPAVREPQLEIMSGTLSFQRRTVDNPTSSKRAWFCGIQLYVTPAAHERLVLPFHRCAAALEFDGVAPQVSTGQFYGWADVRIGERDLSGRGRAEPASPIVVSTSTEFVIDGPGRLHIHGSWGTDGDFVLPIVPKVAFSLRFVGLTREMHVAPDFGPPKDDTHDGLELVSWQVRGAAT